MNPETTLWTLTTAGAAVFFVAGWVANLVRKDASVEAGGLGPGQGEVAALEGELRRARESAARADSLAAQSQALLARLRAAEELASQATAQRRELEQLRGERAGLQATSSALETTRRQLREAEGQIASGRDELEGSVRERRRLATELEQARKAAAAAETAAQATLASAHASRDATTAEAQKRVKQLEAECDGLRKRLAGQELALAAEGAKAAEREARAGKETAALRQELAALQSRWEAERARLAEDATARAAEAERLRAQLAASREEGLEAGDAKAEATALQGQLQGLRLRCSQAEARVRELETQREELLAIREEHDTAKSEVSRLQLVEEEARGLRHRLQAIEAKVREAEDVRVENQELRDRLRELAGHAEASVEVERAQAEIKRLRLEAELARRKMLELEVEAQGHGDTRERLEEMTAVASDARELRERVRALEAKLYALGQEPAGVPGDTAPLSGRVALDSGPSALVQAGARTAVLADGAGLLIAGAGEGSTHEALAALSGLVFEFADRVSSLIPVSGIRLLRLCASDDVVVSWGLLRSGGDPYAVAAIGKSTMQDGALEAAAGLAAGSVMRIEGGA